MLLFADSIIPHRTVSEHAQMYGVTQLTLMKPVIPPTWRR